MKTRTKINRPAAASKQVFEPKDNHRRAMRISGNGTQTTKAGGRSQTKSALPKGATSKVFPIVGIGASAGGLESFTELLKHLSADTGMGFVLVQHLDPQHESALPQLLARVSSMPVREVTNNLRVEPNHVYAIPPNTSLGIAKGILKLHPRQQNRTPARSIDAFFESLAHDQHQRAIGIVLSGTACDGTLGLEAIKAEGGITFAQDDSARYDSMPRSAAAAGCVDFVLKPEDIAKELARIAKHPYVAGQLSSAEDDRATATAHSDDQSPLPSGGHGTSPIGAQEAHSQAAVAHPKLSEDGYKKVILLLRNHSGVDFSLYKSTTIQRRVTRRVVLNKLSSVDEYAVFLRGNAKELDALYSDVLISVTSFFRNPQAFDVLKHKVFARLFQQRVNQPVRIWILGCSTGQEAYSLAMAYVEAAENTPRARKLQVFATDLNDALLDKARQALYAKSLVQDISPERLRRFFVEEEGGYRVTKPLREMVVFARQNLISDPPFSRIDLISCRNLLIYLEPSLQQKAIPTFHYALNPGGFLFLGASESIGRFTDLFEPADRKQKLFARKAAPTQVLPLPIRKARSASSPAGRRPPLPLGKGYPEPSEASREELSAQREADRVSVNQFAPPGVLINADLQIQQFRGATGPYLHPPASGKATFDILKMACEGLLLPLRAAINKARKENRTVRKENVRVQQNGNTRTVHLQVIPLKNLREHSFLILFEDAERVSPALPPAQPYAPPTKKEEASRVSALETELSETRDYLQSIQEQHEAANEELQASNEEVQSANEELQSINEELETSKEELESTNEELTTVNEEMANRNAELNRLNADLTNLQTSTKLPIVLLGRDLTVRRFSEPAQRLFNLLPNDIGRPLSAVRHNLLEPEEVGRAGRTGRADSSVPQSDEPFPLEQVVRRVIDTVHEQEREACDTEGHWYALRVRPYMTVDNKVDGAVLLLIDITSIKLIERQVKLARDYAEATIRTARDPLVILHADLKVERANDAFYKTFKVTPRETENILIYQLDGGQWNIPKLRELLEEIIPRNSFFNDFEVTHEFEHIGRRTMLLNARRLATHAGVPEKILLGIEDITEKIHLDEEVRRSEDRFRSLVVATTQVVWTTNAEGLVEQDSPTWRAFTGQTLGQWKGWGWLEALHPEDRERARATWLESVVNKRIWEAEYRVRTVDGTYRWTVVRAVPVLNADGSVREWIGANTDITERKRAEEALRESEERYRTLFDLGPIALYSTDNAGVIQDFNRRAAELWGHKPVPGATDEQFCGSFKLFRPDGSFMPHEECPMAEVISGKISAARDAEVTIERPDGSRVSVVVNSRPLKNARGETTGAINCFYDVTERKQAEKTLGESERRYRSLFESIDEGFCVVEIVLDAQQHPIDYIFLETNPAFEKHTGLSGAQGRRMLELAPAHERHWFETYGRVALTGEPVRFRRRAEALGRWFDVYAFRVEAPDLRRVAVLFTNITQQCEADEALRAAQAQLADRAGQLEHAVNERTAELTASNKQLEAFIYSVAHDLRAPLRSMQGFSSMLVKEAGPALSEICHDYAQRISKSAQFMDAMLIDMLAFSRISQQRLDLVPVNLETVIPSILTHLEQDIREKNARILAPGPWPSVLAQEPLLVRVLVNVVGNALKFVASEAPPSVLLRSEETPDFIRVWVEDNGIGIAPGHRDQIFRLFNRLHGDKFAGTGIGLAIVQKGVERMGGRVGVESTPGQGSRFWMDFQKVPKQ